MRIIERAVYRGAHRYSRTPMVRIQLDLGELEEWPTSRLPGFTQALIKALPGLGDHGCSYGAPGGLVRRMEEGTWLGHVCEHVALELQSMAGHQVSRGKTRSVEGRPGVYNMMYAYCDEQVGLAAGDLALRLVDSLLPPQLRGLEGIEGADETFELSVALERLRALASKRALGPSTRALVTEAERRGIPVARLDDHSLLRLGWGARARLVRGTITDRTGLIAVEAAGDKDLAKTLLADAGLPTPEGAVVSSSDEAAQEAARLGWPVVVKPLDGNHGRGVSLDLSCPEQVAWAFDHAIRHSSRVIVEQQFSGRDYRILVVGGRVVAVAERLTAHVIGDGTSSVRELIDAANRDPRRGDDHEKVLTRIVVDDHVVDRLQRQGLTLESVPEAGRTVQLSAAANISKGGAAVDRTDEIHPQNAAIAVRAAAVIGLDVAGVDFIAPDISRPVSETGGGIVEINASPGLRMHLAPSAGKPRDVARPILELLFPKGSDGRVPLVAVTGTNGKTTTVQMIAHVLRGEGLTVGVSNTCGAYVGDQQVYEGDASGPGTARMLLADPAVEAAVLETARGGILREGLGFDRCDVGVFLNVTADHLGLKGVDTLEALAETKSVVVECVSRRGTSILNADDPMVLRMAERAGGRLAYFSMSGGEALSPALQKHMAAGGLAAVLEPSIHGGCILVHDRGRTVRIMEAGMIPATLNGIARFNIANALAATLACYAYGVSPERIAQRLATFTNGIEHSPGRLNLVEGYGFPVIIDYAHNPAALEALGEVVEQLRPHYERVIGTVSTPGDRRDEDLREIGRIAARLFDHVVFRERPDQRGRPDGEVCRLMREGALSAGLPESRTQCILEEAEATEACLRLARPGDLVVLLPTNPLAAWRQVESFRPTGAPVEAPDPGRLHA